LTAPFRFYPALAILLISSASQAEPDWSFCSVPVVSRQQAINPISSVTTIEADQLFSESADYIQFSGDVSLLRGSQQLSADLLQLDKAAGTISASGGLSFSDSLLSLNASRITLNDSNSSGEFEQAEFMLYETHLRGAAGSIIQLDSANQELFDVSYTTCDPGQNTWSMNASRLRLDHQDGRGTAHHAVFRLYDIPLFYFPWMQFPIDNRRMSGVLAPTISLSNTDGSVFALPVYWNQAVNYDMTITPISYSNRGLQLNTENRYLFQQHEGQLQLSWLDDDISGETRWYRDWQHQASLGLGIQSSIQLKRASDTEFLEDFDRLEGIEQIDYLKSAVKFTATPAGWSASMLFEEYQIINLERSATAAPYKRLPSISLDRTFASDTSLWQLDWSNNWSRFERESSITGDRLHIAPVISYPMEDSWYYIKPALQLDYTHYALDNNSNDENAIDRSLPLLSMDSGLIFERVASQNRNWLQTLEPRLYLLYVPYEDQTGIPRFDSGLVSENYSSLFVNNRFSGADRVGDSQQLSLGITTRLLDKSNLEFFSASVGQAYYAKERRVSINTQSDSREKSSLMTVINYRPEPSWTLQLSSVYDQLEKESTQTDIAIRRHTQTQAFNLEYHFRKDQLEQSTLSFVYPVTHNWTAFAKRQHSIKHDKPVENLIGLAYESCCWGFKVLYEESADLDFLEVDRSINFQLTFKGLSDAGKDINSILENGILGYQAPF
jgi:LPS-assembly protein